MDPDFSSRTWPAEWLPHAATWLSWPHNPETWPGRFERVPSAFAQFVRAVAEVEPVRLLAADEVARHAEQTLGRLPNIEIIPIATNDCWVRDYGPTFVFEGPERRLKGIDWQYNAWGGKYPPWDLDAAAAPQICRHAQAAVSSSRLTVEGGALETDGDGTLLTTPECLLTDSRNPGWSQEQVESELRRQLGVHEIVWLRGGGLSGDDTDGHIDQLARFVDRQHLVVAVGDPADRENHAGLERNFAQLRLWGMRRPKPVTVHRLPLPRPRRIGGQRVPESYCNFIFCGPRVLVPTFAQPDRDAQALAIFRDLLPGREVLGIDASTLAWGLGAFHCASQQQPA
jgi:agmatine deiminase